MAEALTRSPLHPLTPLRMELEGARAAADIVANIFNPLTPLRLEAQGARIAMDTAKEWAGAAVEGAKAGTQAGISQFGLLGGFSLPELPSLPTLPDLGKAGDDINKLASKALVAEVVLVAGIVAVAGIAGWVMTRREDLTPPIGSLMKMLGKAG